MSNSSIEPEGYEGVDDRLDETLIDRIANPFLFDNAQNGISDVLRLVLYNMEEVGFPFYKCKLLRRAGWLP